jgi:hypothetical protein
VAGVVSDPSTQNRATTLVTVRAVKGTDISVEPATLTQAADTPPPGSTSSP